MAQTAAVVAANDTQDESAAHSSTTSLAVSSAEGRCAALVLPAMFATIQDDETATTWISEDAIVGEAGNDIVNGDDRIDGRAGANPIAGGHGRKLGPVPPFGELYAGSARWRRRPLA